MTGTDNDTPLEVEADDGIEWQQDGKVFIARGNAKATRGTLTVSAKTLKAFYEDAEGGQTKITQLRAEEDVKIASPGEAAYGQLGYYDVTQSVMVLTGGRVRLETKEDRITADQQIEYWDVKRMAVARGNALAVRGDRRLRGDVLVAHMRETGDSKSAVHRVDAYGNIHVVTKEDVITAERGVYEVATGIVELIGKVTLTRGPNQLNGCGATVNLKTGVSRLGSCVEAGKKGGRVRGLLTPDKDLTGE
ncbi:LptA/OstA family protein [Magnetospira sp. QH-2]|uniref:LptA/OstA family protein n=1 Tax=Magnetospira sp. (strain QH-2) TaxID=1288970 RepID=UPI0011DCD0E7|nr:LptA/OstA family protein [Magnetospira sp. QH-2]